MTPAPLGERMAGKMWDARWILAALVVLLTGLALWSASQVRVNNSLVNWFVDDDSSLQSYTRFRERFGSDDVLVVVFRDPDGVVDPEGRELIGKATRALQGVEGVSRVVSMTTEAGAAGTEPPPGELATGRLVSADGTTTAILVQLEVPDDLTLERPSLIPEIDAQLAALGVPYHKAGFSTVYAALNGITRRDTPRLLGISFLVIALLLWALFRRLVPVLVSLTVVALGIVWLMGVYGAAGRDMNVITMVMPTVLLVVGISSCIHTLDHIAHLGDFPTPRERVAKGIGFMIWPCLFATFTTAVGFASLGAAQLTMTRDLGIFLAVGVAGVFVIAMIGCMFVAGYGMKRRSIRSPLVTRVVDALVGLGLRRPVAVVAGAAGLAVVSILGATRIEADAFPLDLLFESHPVRADSRFIEKHLGPYTPVDFVVHAPEGALLPEILATVGEWQYQAELLEGVGWSVSAVDGLQVVARQMDIDGSPEAFGLPTDPADLESVLFQYRMTPGSNYASVVHEPTDLRVTFGIPIQSAAAIGALSEEILAQASLPAGVTVEPAGLLPLWLTQVRRIVLGQVRSFGVAFLLIFALIVWVVRSPRVAAIALPANILPVLLTLGLMGLLGIRLDLGTVTVASVILGLVVDDTIHFFYRLRTELAESEDHVAAVRRTAAGIGHSITVTSVSLALGFLVLVIAQVKSVIWFGLLIAVAILAAWIADLLLGPALITLLKPKLKQPAGAPPTS